MMRFFTLCVALSLFSCSESDSAGDALSLSGDVKWSKTYGGSLDETVGNAVLTSDGGFMVISYTDSDDGDVNKLRSGTDLWLARFDADGNMVWNKTIGGSQDDYGANIIATSDGNFVIAGYSASSDFDVPANIGMHDFLMSKIDIDGNIIWSKNYGFMSHDHAHKVVQTSDGGYFIAGYADYAGIDDNGEGNGGVGHEMRSVQHGVGEFFGVKVNASGDLQWYRYFGGTMNDRVNDVAETHDGGLLMVGHTESQDFDVTNSRGSYDYWVIKLHADGTLHWKENYGGSGIDQAFAVAKTGNNSYLIAGRTNSTDGDISAPIGNSDAWIIHINDHGHLLWEKSFGSLNFDAATSIRMLSDGRFAIAGHTRGNPGGTTNKGQNDFWVFTIDAFANTGIHWQRTFGGSGIDVATDVIETADGLLVTGESQSDDADVPENKGGNDLWMIRLN